MKYPHPLDSLTAALIPIEATDTISAAGRKIILADAIRVLSLDDGVRLSDDPEFIHDMRVATRRMRSALKLLGVYYRPKRVAKLNESLRWLAQLLGTVRDLDVLLGDVSQRELSGLEHTLTDIKSRRDKAHVKLVAGLKSRKFVKLSRRMADFALDTDDLLAGSAPLPVEVRHLVPVLLHRQLASVRGFDPLFNEESRPDYTMLHLLRIAFKQLRYATSFFTGVLGTSAESFVTEMKAVQDHLGRLNDTVVFAAYLGRDLYDHPEDDAIRTLLNTLTAESESLADSFIHVWARFNSRSVQRHLADALLVLR